VLNKILFAAMLAIGLFLAGSLILGAVVALAQGPMGRGAMGGWGRMFGAWDGAGPNAGALTIEQATGAVESYLASSGNGDLQLAEVMEFSGNFYAEVREKSTGTGAFELLVDRYSGAVYPEPGPNIRDYLPGNLPPKD
jgi:hypothetical protein